MPTRGLAVLAVVTVTTVVASCIVVDGRYRETVLEARGGAAVFPAFRGRTDSVAKVEVGRAGSGLCAGASRWRLGQHGTGRLPGKGGAGRDGPLRDRRPRLSGTEDGANGPLSEACRGGRRSGRRVDPADAQGRRRRCPRRPHRRQGQAAHRERAPGRRLHPPPRPGARLACRRHARRPPRRGRLVGPRDRGHRCALGPFHDGPARGRGGGRSLPRRHPPTGS